MGLKVKKSGLIYGVGFFLLFFIGESKALFLPNDFLSSSNNNGVLTPLFSNSDAAIPIWGSGDLGPQLLVLPPNSPQIIKDSFYTIIKPEESLDKKINALTELYKFSNNPEFADFIKKLFSAVVYNAEQNSQRFTQTIQEAQALGEKAQNLMKKEAAKGNDGGKSDGKKNDAETRTSSLPMALGYSSGEKKENASSSADNAQTTTTPVFSAQSVPESNSSSPQVFTSLNKSSEENRMKNLSTNVTADGENPTLMNGEKEKKSNDSLSESEISAKLSYASLNQDESTKFSLLELAGMDKDKISPNPKALLEHVLAENTAVGRKKVSLLLFSEKIKNLKEDEIREILINLDKIIGSEKDTQVKELAVISLGLLAKKNTALSTEVAGVIYKLGEKLIELGEKTDINTDDNTRNYAKTLATVISDLVEASNDGKVTQGEIMNIFKNILDKLPRNFKVFLGEGGEEKKVTIEWLISSWKRLTKNLPVENIDELIKNLIDIYFEQPKTGILSKNL